MLFKGHQEEDIINRVLDGEADAQDKAKLDTILTTPDDLALWDAMQDADRLMRTASMAEPSPDFAARVMAQVYAAETPAQQHEESNGFRLGWRLAVLVLVGLGILVLGRFAFTQLIGPLPTIEDLSMTVNYVVNGVIDIIEWLFGYVARYPALPAIGLASIPLAFAVTWLVVYYTPKEPLRRAAHFLMT